MSEKIRQILDAVTAKVLSYRPVDKGQAAAKIARRLKRQAKKESQSDRKSTYSGEQSGPVVVEG
jgi:hypothetical protein